MLGSGACDLVLRATGDFGVGGLGGCTTGSTITLEGARLLATLGGTDLSITLRDVASSKLRRRIMIHWNGLGCVCVDLASKAKGLFATNTLTYQCLACSPPLCTLTTKLKVLPR